MYTGIYLLQKRWRLKHNESIMVAYDIIMACYPAHGSWRREWGIWSIGGATWEVSGYMAMLQLVYQYSRVFYNVLHYSIMLGDMLQSQMVWKACMGIT